MRFYVVPLKSRYIQEAPSPLSPKEYFTNGLQLTRDTKISQAPSGVSNKLHYNVKERPHQMDEPNPPKQ